MCVCTIPALFRLYSGIITQTARRRARQGALQAPQGKRSHFPQGRESRESVPIFLGSVAGAVPAAVRDKVTVVFN